MRRENKSERQAMCARGEGDCSRRERKKKNRTGEGGGGGQEDGEVLG